MTKEKDGDDLPLEGEVVQFPTDDVELTQYEKENGVAYPSHKHVTDDLIAAVYLSMNCNKSATARRLRMSRRMLYNRIENSPTLLEKIKDAEESLIDTSESILYKLIRMGDFRAVRFHLNAKAKDRGYGESLEIDVTKKAQIIDDEMTLQQAAEAYGDTLNDDGTDIGNL